MNDDTITYLKSIDGRELQDFQVLEFISRLSDENDKRTRQDALNFLMTHKDLTALQNQVLADSNIVRHSIDLLHILKTKARAENYRRLDEIYKNRSRWKKILDAMMLGL